MPKKTQVILVLDETGSMMSCLDATISGFNEYIDNLKRDGDHTLFTLTKFNTAKVEMVHKAVPVKDVPHLTHETYQPTAMTPLYDAIGRTIRETEKELDGKKKKTAFLFVIMTDGEENSSKEFSRQGIFDLIKCKESDGWTFVYLGANQDAWQVGASIGVAKGNSKTYDTAKTKQTFRSLANASVSYRSGGSQSTDHFWDG